MRLELVYLGRALRSEPAYPRLMAPPLGPGFQRRGRSALTGLTGRLDW